MALNLNPAYKNRIDPFISYSMHFRRKEEKTKTKKIQRKVRLKFKHIIFFFLLVGGLFFSFQQLYLFLISWDKLNITEIKILCDKPEVKEDIDKYLNGSQLGNILLFNIDRLHETLSKHKWIKSVRIRKIFPSSLKIEIKERIPSAVLKKEALFLVDREGVLLKQINQVKNMHLPLFIDSNCFEQDCTEKVQLAWKCLESLSPRLREQIEVLDLSDYGNVTVRLKNSPIWIILGNNQFSEKLQSFQVHLTRLEKYGDMEYIDLRFHDRFIIKPRRKLIKNDIPNSEKEAN